MIITKISETIVVVNRATGAESDKQIQAEVNALYPEYSGKVVVQTKKSTPNYPKTLYVKRIVPSTTQGNWLVTKLNENEITVNRVPQHIPVQEVVDRVHQLYGGYAGVVYIVPKNTQKEIVRKVTLQSDGTYQEQQV